MPLALLLSHFQSLPLLSTNELGADSRAGGLVYVLGPCGSLQWTLLWGWEFLLLLQFSQVFTTRGSESLFPCTGTLGCVVCLTPQLFLRVYLYANGGPLSLPGATLPTLSVALPRILSTPAAGLRPSYQSGWMLSLTSWLSDFHTVQFSASSGGVFLFLNLLRPSFGCARKQSISTYASILARSQK